MDDDVVFESTRTLTQAEFADWVERRERWDHLNRFELLDGRVLMTPPAGHPHGEIEANVVARLHAFVRERGLGRVFGSSQGFQLPTGDTLEPDVTFVSRERWDAAPAPEPGKFLRVVPDLVVEIASRSTRTRDRSEKRAAYEKAGVREYWIVDPAARCVIVFVAREARFDEERIFGEHERLASEVLAGFESAVADLLA